VDGGLVVTAGEAGRAPGPEGLVLRPAGRADAARLHEIREAAFAPVFASFRKVLGDELYELAQAGDDRAQGALLDSLLAAADTWEVHVAELDGEIVGFLALRMDRASRVGEIGLNAVDPVHAGRGIGTAMYEWALARMRRAGMRAATVGTGGDPGHAPARRAYEKVGFTVGIPSIWLIRKL